MALIRKSYLLTPEMVERVEELQKEWEMSSQSEVIRELISRASPEVREYQKRSGKPNNYIQERDTLHNNMEAGTSYTLQQLCEILGTSSRTLKRVLDAHPSYFKVRDKGYKYQVEKLTRRKRTKRKARKQKRVGSIKQVKEHLMENFGGYDILELTHYIHDNLRDNSYENFKKVYYWALDKQVELGEITEERAQGEKDYMDISLNHEGLYEDITEGPALRGTALGQFSQEKFIREYIGRIGQGSSYIESRMEDYIAENELEGIITVNELMVAYYATEEEELRKQNIHGEADKQKKYKEYYQRQVEEES